MKKMLARIFPAVALTLFLPSSAAFAATTLVYSDHEPLGGMRTSFLHDVFFPAVEEESEGRLIIESHWDGELAISYDALSAVGRGAGKAEARVDMAAVVPEYAPKELPLQQIFKSFPVGPAGAAQVEFFRSAYAEIPEFPAELERANVVPLFCATGYPVAFFSSAPLDTLDGIAGQRWRSASFWHHDFLQSAGATPVTMPWGEQVFAALRDGEMNGLMVNVDSGYMLNAHEVAPHVLLSKDLWLGHVYLVAMNKDVWDGLAQEDQEAFERAADKAYALLGDVMDKAFGAQVEALRDEDVDVRILTPEEVAMWQAATNYQAAQLAWVEEQTANGVQDAPAVLEQVLTMLEGAAP